MMSWTMDDTEHQHTSASASWATNSKPPQNITDRSTSSNFIEHNRDELSSLCAFKPMMTMMDVVDDDAAEWYMANNNTTIHHNHHHDMNMNMMMTMKDMPFSPANFGTDNNNNLLLHHPVDSSSSCSASPSLFTSSSQVQHFFLTPPNPKTLLLNNNTNLNNPFDLGCEVGFLEPQGSTTSSSSLLGGLIPHELASKNNNTQLTVPNNLAAPTTTKITSVATQWQQNSSTCFAGFQNFEEGSGGKSLFLNRPKILSPLESLPPTGAQPTLFQKRAALRKNMGTEQGGIGVGVGVGSVLSKGKCEVLDQGSDKNKRRVMLMSSGDEMEEASFDDGSALNYDSDDLVESNNNNNTNNNYNTSDNKVMVDENNAKNGGNSSNGNYSTVTGLDQKGKKKGMPAKNLMAERRRRKKLNDRLYMLRSVVPKISKMDRASILGDAIEYLKELLQRINDLHNELESTTPGGSSSLTPASSFHPLTPTPPSLPNHIKEEMCPSSLPSPNGQPARVEVRLREGRAVNIHMFCGRKPGLLLSTMRALDNLGLDIQQAVISCFNGFAMDIFRAEQCKDSQEVHPEQIKALLLDTAGYPGMI